MSDGVSIYILFVWNRGRAQGPIAEAANSRNPTRSAKRSIAQCAVTKSNVLLKIMSFIRNIFHRMSAEEEKDAELEPYDDVSEETSTESSDTGIFTAVNSDLESSGHVDTVRQFRIFSDIGM